MTISRRLAAHRQALASAAPEDPEIPKTPIEGTQSEAETKKEMTTMTDAEIEAAKSEARAEGFASANTRYNAVLASEHYAGRETLAKTLLATSLSADEIVASLAASPTPVAAAAPAAPALTAEQQAAAAEEGGRKAMAEAIAETGNSAVAPGAAAPTARQKSDSVWSRAYGLDKE